MPSPARSRKREEIRRLNARINSVDVLDGLPSYLPALLKVYRTGEKAAGIGFDWTDETGPLAKFNEEWREPEQALQNRQIRRPS